MKDIIEAIGDRIKSPYFGYTILAFIACNWKAVFLLFLTVGTPQERLDAFDSATDIMSLAVIPISVGFFIALSSPWIISAFDFTSKIAFDFANKLKIDSAHKANELKLDSAHKIELKKIHLDKLKTEHLQLKENTLIDNAKKLDEVISKIKDEKVKEILIKERDQLSHNNDKSEKKDLSKEELAILEIISSRREGIFDGDLMAEMNVDLSHLSLVEAMFYIGELVNKGLVETRITGDDFSEEYKYYHITHKGLGLLVYKNKKQPTQIIANPPPAL